MKKLLPYLKPYWFVALISPLMMIGEVLGDLCLPYLMSYIVNFGVEGYSPTDLEHGSPLAAKLIDLFLGADATRMEIIILFGILMLCVTLIGGFLELSVLILPQRLRRDSATTFAAMLIRA